MHRRRFLLGSGALLLSKAPAAQAQIPDGAINYIDTQCRSFMANTGIRGLSAAIGRHGANEMSLTYGVADSEGTPVSIDHRFRIASLSKTLTAVAIMKLCDEGKLSLDDAVFGPGSIFGNRYGPTGDRLRAIRIRHLLSHTLGGWTNDGSDPTMNYGWLDQHELIERVIATHPLEWWPGQVQRYSNFGYCLLGRVVEQVTDEGYEDWVTGNVLLPSGVQTMQVGRDLPGPLEVEYFPSSGDATSLNIQRLDANGGWIATPSDLVALLAHIDGAGYQNIISKSAVNAMAARPTPGALFGHGWAVNDLGNRWHTGLLPGTSTFMCITSRGYYFVALTNSGGVGKDFAPALDNLMWLLSRSVPGWNP